MILFPKEKALKATASRLLKSKCGAQEWIRTITTLRMLRPEHSASTNFATWAGVIFQDGKYRKRTFAKAFFLK